MIFLEGRCLACPNLVTYTAISFLMSTCVCGLRSRMEQGAAREKKRVAQRCTMECSWSRIGLPWWVKKKAKEGGGIILCRADWCLECISPSYSTQNYISQAFIFIVSTADRSYFSETTPASRTLVRSLVGLFNSAPGPGGVDRVVVVLRDKISWSNSLFIQAWCVTTFPYHIPPLTDDPVHSRCTQV
jgi:hypothetical protein